MTFTRDRPLTGAEVEFAICEMLDRIEVDAAEHAAAQLAAARAEVEYRRAYAHAVLAASVKTETQRAAYAQFHASELYAARREAEARAAGAAETCRVRRAQLDALRTIASNARAAEHG